MSDTVLTARDFMFSVFQDTWTVICPDGPVDYQDLPFEPPTSEVPWVRVTLRHAPSAQSSLTDPLMQVKRYTNTGTLFLQIMAPVGGGLTRLFELGQAVTDSYRRARHPNIWFSNATLQEAPSGRGPWAQVTVTVDFQYDTII